MGKKGSKVLKEASVDGIQAQVDADVCAHVFYWPDAWGQEAAAGQVTWPGSTTFDSLHRRACM